MTIETPLGFVDDAGVRRTKTSGRGRLDGIGQKNRWSVGVLWESVMLSNASS